MQRPKGEFNFVVANEFVRGDESAVFFDGEHVELIPPETTWWDLLVRIGVFRSKSQARKNPPRTRGALKLGAAGTIPDGWTDWTRLGKLNLRLTVLNPIDDREIV